MLSKKSLLLLLLSLLLLLLLLLLREIESFEKDVFRLVSSVGQRKNSEFPFEIEPQTFGFRTLMLYQ